MGEHSCFSPKYCFQMKHLALRIRRHCPNCKYSISPSLLWHILCIKKKDASCCGKVQEKGETLSSCVWVLYEWSRTSVRKNTYSGSTLGQILLTTSPVHEILLHQGPEIWARWPTPPPTTHTSWADTVIGLQPAATQHLSSWSILNFLPWAGSYTWRVFSSTSDIPRRVFSSKSNILTLPLMNWCLSLESSPVFLILPEELSTKCHPFFKL